MLLTQAETEELGRRILALSSAQGCAVLLEGHESDNFRFASRGGATNGTTTGARLSVTSSFGQRQGRATTNALDDASCATWWRVPRPPRAVRGTISRSCRRSVRRTTARAPPISRRRRHCGAA